MQRITRIAFDQNNVDKMQSLEQYNSLLSILKPHLTARTFSIFASPKLIENNQYIAWYTHLEGQPILLSDINESSQKAIIEDALLTRINDIETTVKLIPLNNQQKVLVSSWLSRIKSPNNQIYVINNEPVIIDTFEPMVLPEPPIVVPKSFWRWWYTLILVLLLLLILGLIWLFFNPFKKTSKIEPIVEPAITQSIETKKTELSVEFPKQPELVLKLKPELKLEPQPVVVPDPTPESVSKSEPKPAPKVKNPPNCITKEELVKNSNPSKMALIFDNSLSMTVTLAEPPSQVQQYFNYLTHGYPSYMPASERIAYEKRMSRLPTRLSTSKKVALTSIDKIQQNINIALVALNSCPVADTTPFYNYSGRGALKSKINRLTPSAAGGGGTPLYSGLEKASKMLDGVKRDDYILIISDGDDNCSRNNICTLANYIATQKPRLKINIVDIAGEHKIDCVANATRGKVYIAQSPKDMIRQMNKAVSDLKINRPVCQ